MMLSAIEQSVDLSEKAGASPTIVSKPVVVIPHKCDDVDVLANDLKINERTMKIDETDPPEPDSNEGTEGNAALN